MTYDEIQLMRSALVEIGKLRSLLITFLPEEEVEHYEDYLEETKALELQLKRVIDTENKKQGINDGHKPW